MILERRLMASDLFDDLEEEERQTKERKIEVERSPCLDWLLGGLEKYRKDKVGYDRKRMVGAIPYKITAKDIENLSILYKGLMEEGETIGLYLSTCINNCVDKNLRIHTKHMESPPDYLGEYNDGKIIEVFGDVGSNLGYRMESGLIVVYGNSGNSTASYLSGGTIRVKGEANSISCFYGIGWNMIGGEVHIEGENVPIISPGIGCGDIYHKGKLIVKDGKEVK
jgi:hypothetical protein